jgi:ribosomal-protein-serine acetyltransferase
MRLSLFDTYYLQSIQLDDAEALFQTIEANRAYLDKWLTFIAHTHSKNDSTLFIQSVVNNPQLAKEPVFTIRDQDKIIGLIGFKGTDVNNVKSEIGYWIAAQYQKKGIVRIQLKCAVGNVPSRNIALRLGFQFEGIERAGERCNDGTYRDLEVFSLLKSEHILL